MKIPLVHRITSASSTGYFLVILFFILLADLMVCLNVPVLRPVFGFLLLTFVPGWLITQILKLDRIQPAERIAVSAGLSISVVMLAGAIINIIGITLHISHPISLESILFAVNLLLVILVPAAWYCQKDTQVEYAASIKQYIAALFSSPVLLLLWTLLMGILGGVLIQKYESSLAASVSLCLIIIVMVLAAFGKVIRVAHYSLAVFIIGATLLLSHTFTSPHLFGIDIQYEYHYAQLTQIGGSWDSVMSSSPVNAMLSTVILPNEYSLIMGLDLVWIYKLVFPLIFGLVPVVLYQVFRRQVGEKMAFLSAFFFMSFYGFFVTMLWLPRQQIAELFFALIILLLVHKGITPFTKKLLYVFFIMSLAVSHYALGYIFLLYMACSLVIIPLLKIQNPLFKPVVAMFSFMVFTSWYMHVANSGAFSVVVEVGRHIVDAVVTELFNPNMKDPEVAMALGGGIFDQGLLHAVSRLWQLAVQFLLVIGVVYAVLRRNALKFDREFLLISIISMLIIGFSIAVPLFSSSLRMDRLFGLALFGLAPFCLIGLALLIRWVLKILRAPSGRQIVETLAFLALLVPYFTFNTGLVYEAVEHPQNHMLNYNNIDRISMRQASYFDWSNYIIYPFTGLETAGSQWAARHAADGKPVYADLYGGPLLIGYGLMPPERIESLVPETPAGEYIFLGSKNVWGSTFNYLLRGKVHVDVDGSLGEINPPLETRHLVYSNGGSQLWK